MGGWLVILCVVFVSVALAVIEFSAYVFRWQPTSTRRTSTLLHTHIYLFIRAGVGFGLWPVRGWLSG